MFCCLKTTRSQNCSLQLDIWGENKKKWIKNYFFRRRMFRKMTCKLLDLFHQWWQLARKPPGHVFGLSKREPRTKEQADWKPLRGDIEGTPSLISLSFHVDYYVQEINPCVTVGLSVFPGWVKKCTKILFFPHGVWGVHSVFHDLNLLKINKSVCDCGSFSLSWMDKKMHLIFSLRVGGGYFVFHDLNWLNTIIQST